VSILAVSTGDTDYLLVQNRSLRTAGDALGAAGHAVRDDGAAESSA